jgi:hypothetical protein
VIGNAGTVVPQLSKMLGFMAVAVTSGAVWALWHYPLIVLRIVDTSDVRYFGRSHYSPWRQRFCLKQLNLIRGGQPVITVELFHSRFARRTARERPCQKAASLFSEAVCLILRD